MTSARNPIFSLNEHNGCDNALRFLIQPLRCHIHTHRHRHQPLTHLQSRVRPRATPKSPNFSPSRPHVWLCLIRQTRPVLAATINAAITMTSPRTLISIARGSSLTTLLPHWPTLLQCRASRRTDASPRRATSAAPWTSTPTAAISTHH